MTIIEAIILGLVQGLGEFLPISSSGHLILTPWLFHWDDPGLAFDVALHFGTLVAVVAYFWKDWLEILSMSFWQLQHDARGLIFNDNGEGKRQESQYPTNFLSLVILATIPGALAGLLLEEKAETVFRSPLLVAGTLSGVGLIMYLTDRYLRHSRTLSRLRAKDALLIGLAQAAAIVPGVSRSGATITGALASGYDRVSAARFSFLISTPLIFGATLMQLDDFLAGGFGAYEVLGIVVAAASGYLAIAGLLKFVQKVSYKVFFWYRLALALLIVFLWSMR